MTTFLQYLIESKKKDALTQLKERKIFSFESSIDYPRSQTLDPTIWEIDKNGNYTLNSHAKTGLMALVSAMPKIFNKVHIIGSICSNLYRETSDIDLHFVVNDGLDEQKIAAINSMLWSQPEVIFNVTKDKLKIGTHPIEIFLQTNTWSDYSSIGCYDLLNDAWVSGPDVVDADYDPSVIFAGAKKQIEKYGKLATNAFEDLRIAIIDYQSIKDSLSNDNAALLTRKLAKQGVLVKKCMATVAKIRQELTAIRKSIKQPKNAKDAEKMRASKEWQNANALWKFMQRYQIVDKAYSIEDAYNDIIHDNATIDQKIPMLRRLFALDVDYKNFNSKTN